MCLWISLKIHFCRKSCYGDLQGIPTFWRTSFQVELAQGRFQRHYHQMLLASNVTMPSKTAQLRGWAFSQKHRLPGFGGTLNVIFQPYSSLWCSFLLRLRQPSEAAWELSLGCSRAQQAAGVPASAETPPAPAILSSSPPWMYRALQDPVTLTAVLITYRRETRRENSPSKQPHNKREPGISWTPVKDLQCFLSKL